MAPQPHHAPVPWLKAASGTLTGLTCLSLLGGMIWYMDSAVLVGWFGPLLTVVPLTFLCRRWFKRPLALGLSIYGLAILSGILAMELMGMSNQQSAEFSAFVFPVCYGLILTCLHLVLARGPRHLRDRLQRLLGDAPALASALGGAAAGALVGAFFGGVSYYVCDQLIWLELFMGEERALEVWVGFCTLCGIGQGGLEGHKLAASPQS